MEAKEEEMIALGTASGEVSREFQTLISSNHLETLVQLQRLVLGRLQDSNAVLSRFNNVSEDCFDEVATDFAKNTRLLRSIKTDLDYIFQKLRSMKSKISATYPDAFPEGSHPQVLDTRPDLETWLP